MEDIIQVENVRKVYRMGSEKIVAIDSISLSFQRGKIYCLLGPSGSGKSTLLNLMAGLEKPSKGSIKINRQAVSRMNEKELAKFRQKYIGFVFQSYNLLPTLTALENVTLPLIFRGESVKRRNKKAMAMLKAVGLSDRGRHKPSEMSGGQQQRVCLARAFVNNPEVIFADEPTGNLDTKTTMEMMSLMVSMVKSNKQTLIIVTHNIELACFANQVIHIRDGKVEQIEDREAPDVQADATDSNTESGVNE